MKLRLSIPALVGLAACGQVALAGPCAGLSKRTDDDPDRPETWTRSDYDQCMAKEANKTNPANEELCRAASGVIHEGRCVLEIA